MKLKSKSYYIKTFGCQMNVSDSERIAGFLELHKFKPAKDTPKADLVIFNTCGVRQMAEDRVYGHIHNLRENNPNIKIVLTGCLANRKDVQRKLKDKVDLFCEIKDFPQSLTSFFLLHSSSNKNCNYLKISPRYTTKQTAFVPIMTGCNNFCSYCVVPYARGHEVSRPAEDIISEINNLSKKSCREITLLGQNVNSYKYQFGNLKLKNWDFIGNLELEIRNYKIINFPKLLNLLSRSYPNIIFHFLTSHPKDFSEELMDVIAKNKNISREIHLPFQAGSDKILRLMNRPYTQKHYLNLIKKAQEKIPGVSFTTDVIVGFPGETEKDFQESVKVFKKVSYNEAYINKYSPRPGTAAYKLGDSISWEEKKRREKILRDIVRTKQCKKKAIN
jgi:tRNA-2-methylthio-N6-dimethylallyladenosine synthase